MKRSRSAKEQIIAILRDQEAGCSMVDMQIDVVMMATFGRVFARSRSSIAGSATDGWGLCWRVKASSFTTRSCCGFTVREINGCVADAAANGRWEHEHR